MCSSEDPDRRTLLHLRAQIDLYSLGVETTEQMETL